MTNQIRNIAVAEAVNAHTVESYDAGHDLAHHEAVWKNCQQIIDQNPEFAAEVDMDALEIAAMWHDFRRGSEDYSLLADTLKRSDATDEFVDKVIGIIACHSFGNGQETLEAKILFDADKLEYVSVERFERVAVAVRNDEMTTERLEKYRKVWNERMVSVREMLHFENTKIEFDRRLGELRDYFLTEELFEGF